MRSKITAESAVRRTSQARIDWPLPYGETRETHDEVQNNFGDFDFGGV